METVVTRFLSDRGVPYKLKRHLHPAYNCEEAARERGVRVSQIVKCMVGMDIEGDLHVMLIPGDKILKLKKVRSLAGGIKIDLMCREALAENFGVVVGAISPTQFAGIATFYMDHSVFLEDDIDIFRRFDCRRRIERGPPGRTSWGDAVRYHIGIGCPGPPARPCQAAGSCRLSLRRAGSAWRNRPSFGR